VSMTPVHSTENSLHGSTCSRAPAPVTGAAILDVHPPSAALLQPRLMRRRRTADGPLVGRDGGRVEEVEEGKGRLVAWRDNQQVGKDQDRKSNRSKRSENGEGVGFRVRIGRELRRNITNQTKFITNNFVHNFFLIKFIVFFHYIFSILMFIPSR